MQFAYPPLRANPRPGPADYACFGEDWSAIRQSHIPPVVEERGIQFASGNEECSDTLWSIGAGDIALVKGWLFGEGHDPCLHRSPPIAGTGERRLLLAIDTPRIDPEPEE